MLRKYYQQFDSALFITSSIVTNKVNLQAQLNPFTVQVSSRRYSFFFSSTRQLRAELCTDYPILREHRHLSGSAWLFRSAAQYQAGSLELYEEGGELFIKHVHQDRRSLPNPTGNTRVEADKLPLFQQLETPRIRGFPAPRLQSSSFCSLSFPSALPGAIVFRFPNGRTNRLRYRAAVRAA